ncbi:MAG: RluA family pseudouridine synthase, partial [Myxococcota bacterium]
NGALGVALEERTHTVEIDEAAAGARLDRALADGLGVSRARVRHLLEVGRIRVDEATLQLADKSRAVAAGERYAIEGALEAEAERPIPRPDLPLEIVGEGEGWLCVDKPAGCGVHPLRPDQDDTVLNALVARRPGIVGIGESGLRSGVVHRLDVGTTGALLFASDEECWRRLRGAFSAHRLDKRYLALVSGRLEERRRVDLPLAITRHQPAHVSVRDDGRPTRQRVTPLEVFADATLVEVRLETGFLHQIRASLAHVGHPLVGDPDYGGPAPDAAGRPMLHAARLRFDEISVTVDPPSDFQAAVDARRANAG